MSDRLRQCPHCGDTDPILCEGYCVRCGQAPLEPGSDARLSVPFESGLSFRESVSVGWVFAWRAAASAAALAAGLSSLIPNAAAAVPAGAAAGLALGLLWGARRIAKKRFRGFSLVVVRSEAVGQAALDPAAGRGPAAK